LPMGCCMCACVGIEGFMGTTAQLFVQLGEQVACIWLLV